MTDNITLRRAVGDEVRDLLCHADFTHFHFAAKRREMLLRAATALAALDAALAEPDAICSVKDNEAALERVANRVKPGQVKGLLPEPDATREPVHPGYLIGSHWLETAYSRIAAGEAEADVLAEVLGARGWAKRKPATMKQIITAHGTTIGAPWFEDFARAWKAAERFYGIRKEDKT